MCNTTTVSSYGINTSVGMIKIWSIQYIIAHRYLHDAQKHAFIFEKKSTNVTTRTCYGILVIFKLTKG